MPMPKLVIGNKNYSSWSLRQWLAMKVAGIDFEEVFIEFDNFSEKWTTEILKYSPTKKVPTLIHDDVTVWESTAILEYLNDAFPDAGIWPADIKARTMARTVSAEMHAGFGNLRTHCPMNIRASFPGVNLDQPGVQDDIDRVAAIWNECRANFGQGGDFLFGKFSGADAMFAPVVWRLTIHAAPMDAVCTAYMDAVKALPAMVEWADAGRAEPWTVDFDEI